MSVVKDWPDEPEQPVELRAEDHCWLHADGQDLRIIGMSWPYVHVLTNQGRYGVLDLSGVDWDHYCKKAVEMLRFMWTF